MNKNFLIVGFGGMGCRHAQSLVNSFEKASIYVIEPNKHIFEKNLALIEQKFNNKIKRLSNFNEINFKVEFCVIATSSGPRFDILKHLLQLDIKYFLVEKVVFQNLIQFKEISKIIGAKKVYVNFVNRYFDNYIRIRKEIKDKPFSIDIIGGEFGLGCNALHYFDLFQYFGARKIKLDKFKLIKSLNNNKRGDQYIELLGQISLKSENGSKLNISSDEKREGGVDLVIKTSEGSHYINEGSFKHIHFSENSIETSPLFVQYTSNLTSIIYSDIINSECFLPTISETQNIHSLLFEAVNCTLKLKSNEICPIT